MEARLMHGCVRPPSLLPAARPGPARLPVLAAGALRGGGASLAATSAASSWEM